MAGSIKKGIILAGGSGTRLYPTTEVVCKQLLPIYDKPMIYYPLSTLMMFGITDVLIISTPDDIPKFESLLGDGSRIGMKFRYKVQPEPKGIAQAFLLGEEFIGNDPVALILGDNIFHGIYDIIKEARNFKGGGQVFGYYVSDPERYGVAEFDSSGKVITIEEKPAKPKSNYAVTGLYLYDSSVVQVAKYLQPSGRGELEITDVNKVYLKRGDLKLIKLGRGIAWLDTGTQDSMLEAGNFIAMIEKRQGQKIACIEELAYRMKFINATQMSSLIESMPANTYRAYLEEIVQEADSVHS